MLRTVWQRTCHLHFWGELLCPSWTDAERARWSLTFEDLDTQQNQGRPRVLVPPSNISKTVYYLILKYVAKCMYVPRSQTWDLLL